MQVNFQYPRESILVKSSGKVEKRSGFFEIDRAKFTRNQTSQTYQSQHSAPIHRPRMPIPFLPLELWQKILELLDIPGATAISKAHPRFFGAFIESTQWIRFRNAINSFMRSNTVGLPVGSLPLFICSVMCDSSLKYSGLLTWIARRVNPILSKSSSIVVNRKLFKDLSSTIALKDRGFLAYHLIYQTGMLR
jgi:hypothetical protein